MKSCVKIPSKTLQYIFTARILEKFGIRLYFWQPKLLFVLLHCSLAFLPPPIENLDFLTPLNPCTGISCPVRLLVIHREVLFSYFQVIYFVCVFPLPLSHNDPFKEFWSNLKTSTQNSFVLEDAAGYASLKIHNTNYDLKSLFFNKYLTRWFSWVCVHSILTYIIKMSVFYIQIL